MNEINSISTLATPTTLREFAQQTARPSRVTDNVSEADHVEISELAGFLSRLAELPESQARRIVEIRNAIHNGTYETADKLEIATDRLFAEL